MLRNPQFGAVAPIAILLAALCPVPSSGQTWGTTTGYNDLIAELGGAPATEYDEVVLIAAADASWRYRKGTSEASSPTDAWRESGFVEDGSWVTGQTPIGYGDGDDNTLLNDMEGSYTSVYLRKTFNVTAGAMPARLLLRVYVDDGAIVWINGKEVERFHVPDTPSFVAYNATAQNHEAEWEEFLIKDAGEFLVEGNNIIAIHALNQDLNSSDFSIDAELVSPALRVTQVEANPSGTRNYLPQAWPTPPPTPSKGDSFAGVGNLSGQTLFVQSADSDETFDASSHSLNVATRFFSSSSLSPGVALVDMYDASGWLDNDFLRSETSSAPLTEPNVAQNHSWIATLENGTASELNEIIRRQDYAIQRDGFLATIGLNNGSGNTVPPVFGSCYNAMAVGRTDGNHSRNGTIDSGIDGPGRIKPDLVASDSATSYTTPQVGSAACLLMANANTRGWGKVFTSHVMKAILMAGATKSEFQTGGYTWSRTTAQPLDAIYGAGELNVQHSYHILDAGEQSSGASSGRYGWDQDSLGPGGSTSYTLVLTEDISELSCILTWNRTIDSASWLGGGGYSETVADMSLDFELGGGSGSESYDSSDSSVDNVEHVYLRGIPAGTYTLTVSTDVAVDFGLAWRADAGTLPDLAMTEGTVSGDADFAFSDLAIGKEYVLKSSTDLVNWTDIHTFTATAATDSHTHAGGLTNPRTFYRLVWDPVN